MQCTTLLRPGVDTKHRTFCVMGSARGGTSMIAGLLDRFDIPMNANKAQRSYEDVAFRETVRKMKDMLASGVANGWLDRLLGKDRSREMDTQLQMVLEMIESRNRTHNTWGWKDPESMVYINTIEHALRNPHYIVVFRDPLAVAQRELDTGHHKDLMATLELVVLTRYRLLLEHLEKSKAPALLVSYERSLWLPGQLVDTLSGFCHIELTGQQRQQCIDFIQPNKHFLE